jgi:hypothetical protein
MHILSQSEKILGFFLHNKSSFCMPSVTNFQLFSHHPAQLDNEKTFLNNKYSGKSSPSLSRARKTK